LRERAAKVIEATLLGVGICVKDFVTPKEPVKKDAVARADPDCETVSTDEAV